MHRTYRGILYITALALLAFPSYIFAAEMSVKINVKDDETALVDVVYPISNIKDKVWVLGPTNPKKTSIYTYGRTFLSATGKDGRERKLIGKKGSEAVALEKGDKVVTLHYKVEDFFDNEEISLFNFPLLIYAPYDSAKVEITTPSNMTVLSSPGDDPKNGGNTTHFSVDLGYKVKGYAPKSISIFTHSELRFNDYSYKQNGRYIALEPKSYSFQKTLSETLSESGFVDQVLMGLFGQKLPSKVVVAAVPLAEVPGYNYLLGGLTVNSNLVLISEDQFFGYRDTDLRNKLLILHELTHVLQLTHLFKGREMFPMKGWMSEGMAVFAEQYALDNYLRDEFSEDEIEELGPRFQKFTRSEVDEMYNRRFDENFDIDTDEQPISLTYRHAGFIFANLYHRDKTVIKKLFTELKSATPSFCTECTLITTRKTLEKLTKLKTNQILYPMKDIILIPDKKTDALFKKE